MATMIWLALLLIIGAVIFFRSGKGADPGDAWLAEGTPLSDTGLLAVKVIVCQFDEQGVRLLVNGSFRNNCGKSIHIEEMVATVESGGEEHDFVPYELGADSTVSDYRDSSLLQLVPPATVRSCEGGLFRAPFFMPGPGDKMSRLLDDLGKAARLRVYELDSRSKGYSIEGDALRQINDDFLDERWVRELCGEIGELLFWRAGPLKIVVKLIDEFEEVADEVVINADLEYEDERLLRENVERLALNALYREFELETELFPSVVIEW